VVGLRANASAFFIFVAIHVRCPRHASCALLNCAHAVVDSLSAQLLVELNAEGLTLLFTAMTRSEKLASAVAPVPLVLNILFGGFFVSPSAIPVWLRWLRYLAFMRWSYVAVVRNEMDGRSFDCAPGAPPEVCARDGDAAIDMLVPDSQLGVAACAWVLTGMVLACWVGTYAVLRRNKPRYDSSV
jgi:hypothetical protein